MQHTPSVPKYVAYNICKIQTSFSLTKYIYKSIDIRNTKSIWYEIIFHDDSNSICLVL
jgi:hypothetical protein